MLSECIVIEISRKNELSDLVRPGSLLINFRSRIFLRDLRRKTRKTSSEFVINNDVLDRHTWIGQIGIYPNLEIMTLCLPFPSLLRTNAFRDPIAYPGLQCLLLFLSVHTQQDDCSSFTGN